MNFFVAIFFADWFVLWQHKNKNNGGNVMRGTLITFMALNMLAGCMDQQQVYQQGLTAYDAAAFQACQDIKPNKNFNEMKRKKNCFRDLPLSYDAGAFQVCQDIKPNKNFNEMKRKKNCFRDLPLSY